MKEARHRDHVVCDSVCVTRPEQAGLWRQKDWWLSGPGRCRRAGVVAEGRGGSSCGSEMFSGGPQGWPHTSVTIPGVAALGTFSG